MRPTERGIQLQRRENKQKEDGKNQVTNFADFIILPKVCHNHSLGYYGEDNVKSNIQNMKLMRSKLCLTPNLQAILYIV